MSKVNALVLRAAGVNCNEETAYALTLGGADCVEQLHVNRLIEKPDALDRFNFLVVPGGFSYGDDISAGRILAKQLELHLGDALRRFVSAGKLVLGICNGFQVLVKAGLLPGLPPMPAGPTAGGNGQATAGANALLTITANDRGRFEDRWVHLTPASRRNVFLPAGGPPIYLPIAHGEGKLAVRDAAVLTALQENDLVAVRYASADGSAAGGVFPLNPNGAVDDIAGLCDPTGQIFGLMPHPERHSIPTQHPQWTRRGLKPADGLAVFTNGVQFLRRS
ncbi:MAG: Phosphoribosylformylglycinamidine synthase subunit PurQ [Phycisphaerae bacterium]|nr:Phosphoribosylformylglycinamidine synthase subunit PurQ [Phycisphaerae bacterium]